jgi:hypothetical protein
VLIIRFQPSYQQGPKQISLCVVTNKQKTKQKARSYPQRGGLVDKLKIVGALFSPCGEKLARRLLLIKRFLLRIFWGWVNPLIFRKLKNFKTCGGKCSGKAGFFFASFILKITFRWVLVTLYFS